MGIVILYVPCCIVSLLTSCARTLSCLDDFSVTCYCNDNNIFRGEAGQFGGGGSFYPSNTLDRTLSKRDVSDLLCRGGRGCICVTVDHIINFYSV